ncbi:MAG: folate-binding protein [Betaproteobacteria bacterium]
MTLPESITDRLHDALTARGRVAADHATPNAASASDALPYAAPAIVRLVDEGLLLVSGADSREFLQGQLTNDMEEVTADQALLCAYCTPKGRVLATLTICKWRGDYLLQMPSELVDSVRKRLQMYVMRSQVKLEALANVAIIGVTGDAGALLRDALGLATVDEYRCSEGDGIVAVGLPGRRVQLVVPADRSQSVWDRLSGTATPMTEDTWTLAGIASGVPVVTAATSDLFLPQMLNLDLVGGVSFRKGCYTGQEIIARTQYLGQVKRRLARFAGASATVAGSEIYSGERSVGTVINAAVAPGGGYEVLAVVGIETADAPLQLDPRNGAALQSLALPYALPQATLEPDA